MLVLRDLLPGTVNPAGLDRPNELSQSKWCSLPYGFCLIGDAIDSCSADLLVAWLPGCFSSCSIFLSLQHRTSSALCSPLFHCFPAVSVVDDAKKCLILLKLARFKWNRGTFLHSISSWKWTWDALNYKDMNNRITCHSNPELFLCVCFAGGGVQSSVAGSW